MLSLEHRTDTAVLQVSLFRIIARVSARSGNR